MRSCTRRRGSSSPTTRGSSPPTRAPGTIKKRFDSIALESTEENRRAYRDMLFTTPGLEEYVSGVILYDETIRQSAADGTPFAEAAGRQGDHSRDQGRHGREALAGAPGETVTEGLDGLRERLEEYRELGARFAKWRAVITIGDGLPTNYCICDERARAGALRGALPGAGARADRRARGADGRRPRRSRPATGRRRGRCTPSSTSSTTSGSISRGCC